MEEELRDRWAVDLGRGRLATTTLESLLARYQEPHRRYHGVAHVLRVVRTVDELMATGDPLTASEVGDPAAVRLAAWYHDAIYDPQAASGVNEADSAALARRDLTALGQPPERADAVERLVLVTIAHTPGAIDEAILCDADLAVLAADPATYAAYANGVRAEYAHVGTAAWREGRTAVLRSLLDRPVLFHIPAMAGANAMARANLTAELATLT